MSPGAVPNLLATMPRLGPVELVLPPSAPIEAAPFPWMSVGAGVVATALVVAAWWIWRTTPPPDPGEEAFARLTRILGLTRRERRLLRELATAHGSATPTAILLCAGAREVAGASLHIPEDAWRSLERKLAAGETSGLPTA